MEYGISDVIMKDLTPDFSLSSPLVLAYANQTT